MPLTLPRSRRLQRKSPRLPKTPSRLEEMSGTFHASVLAERRQASCSFTFACLQVILRNIPLMRAVSVSWRLRRCCAASYQFRLAESHSAFPMTAMVCWCVSGERNSIRGRGRQRGSSSDVGWSASNTHKDSCGSVFLPSRVGNSLYCWLGELTPPTSREAGKA